MVPISILLSVAGAADLFVGPTGDYATLNGALQAAETGDHIYLEPGFHQAEEVIVDIPLTLHGAGATLGPIDGGPGPILTLLGTDLTLEDVTFEAGGRVAVSASSSLVTIIEGGISGATGVDGGAVRALSSTVDVDAATFSSNSALWGADFYVEGSSLTVRNTELSGGNASVSGGSVYANFSTVLLDNVTIEDSTSPLGGALYVQDTGGSTVLDDCVIRRASSTNNVIDLAGPSTVTDSLITDNTSEAGSVLFFFDPQDVLAEANELLDNDVGGPLLQVMGLGGPVSSVEIASNTACRNTSQSILQVFFDEATFHNNLVAHHTTLDGPLAVSVGRLESVNNTYAGLTVSTIVGPVLSDAVLWHHNDLAVGWNLGTTQSSSPNDPSSTLRADWVLAWNLEIDFDPLFETSNLVRSDPLLGAWADGDCSPELFVPLAGSPAIDAGDPAITDVDGSVSDIGAFGGPEPFLLETTEIEDGDGDGWDAELDCNDEDPNIHPEADEIPCDGVDNDCSNETTDADPSIVEVCNEVDDDCDGTVDELEETLFADADGDGFGSGERLEMCVPVAMTEVDGDCDDANAAVYPGASEIRDDAVDQDCDGADLATYLDGALGCTHGPSGAGWAALGAMLLARRRR